MSNNSVASMAIEAIDRHDQRKYEENAMDVSALEFLFACLGVPASTFGGTMGRWDFFERIQSLPQSSRKMGPQNYGQLIQFARWFYNVVNSDPDLLSSLSELREKMLFNARRPHCWMMDDPDEHIIASRNLDSIVYECGRLARRI